MNAANVTAKQLLRKSISTLRRRSGSVIAMRTRGKLTQRNDALVQANEQLSPKRPDTNNLPAKKRGSPKQAETAGTKRKPKAKRGALVPANNIIPGAVQLLAKDNAHSTEPSDCLFASEAPAVTKKPCKKDRPANCIIPGAVCVPSRKAKAASNADA